MNKDEQMPFKMSLSDPLSIWRAETFWSKEPETIEWLKFFGNFTCRCEKISHKFMKRICVCQRENKL